MQARTLQILLVPQVWPSSPGSTLLGRKVPGGVEFFFQLPHLLQLCQIEPTTKHFYNPPGPVTSSFTPSPLSLPSSMVLEASRCHEKTLVPISIRSYFSSITEVKRLKSMAGKAVLCF